MAAMQSLLLGLATTFAAFAATHSYFLKRPSCKPTESCRFDLGGISIQFCDCPGENAACPTHEDHSATIHGKRYQFCAPVKLDLCEDGEVASELFQSVRQEFLCVCPEFTRLRSTVRRHDQNTVQYTCETITVRYAQHVLQYAQNSQTTAVISDSTDDQPTACPTEGLCAVRDHGETADGQLTSTFRTLCDCPDRSVCRMIDESVIVKGRQEEHGYCVA